MRTFLFTFICVVAATSLSDAQEVPVRVRVELGKPFSYDFGAGNYVINRHTDIRQPKWCKGVQYIFAAPGVRGWTTDGTDVIGEGVRLHWNGTLEFDEIEETDLCEYHMPREPPPPNPTTLNTRIIFYAYDDDDDFVFGK